MAFVYWSAESVPRIFYEVETQAELRRVRALNIPEGSCKVVGCWTYMHLPDKPVLALGGADSVLQPAPSKKIACEESDLKFF